jgi:hypothetical protein
METHKKINEGFGGFGLEVYKKLQKRGILKNTNNFLLIKNMIEYYFKNIKDDEKLVYFIDSLPSIENFKEYISKITQFEKYKEILLINALFILMEYHFENHESPVYEVSFIHNYRNCVDYIT